VGDDKETTDENVVGEIVVRGTSIFDGYATPMSPTVGSSDAPGQPERPDQVDTGDLGFLHGGELYIVDRLKSIVIINGVNYPAADLEERVAAAIGVAVDGVMVFDEAIAGDMGTVVAVAETGADTASPEPEALQAISGLLSEIYCVKRRSLPKTTSGKKQHHLCRSLLASGRLPVLKTISLPASRRSP
jgi:acyl-CoA synthetase (AMP-forming)/AMP-acid ligase II